MREDVSQGWLLSPRTLAPKNMGRRHPGMPLAFPKNDPRHPPSSYLLKRSVQGAEVQVHLRCVLRLGGTRGRENAPRCLTPARPDI